MATQASRRVFHSRLWQRGVGAQLLLQQPTTPRRPQRPPPPVLRSNNSTSTLPKVGDLAEPKSGRKFRPAEDGKRYVREVSRLGAEGNWRGVLSLLSMAEGDGTVVNRIMYNATIAALSKSMRWQEAIAVLDRMGAKDVISFSSAMDACRAAGKPAEAYQLLSRMVTRREGVKPNTWCFNTVLSAFAKQGQYRRALSLVEVDMPRAGVMPNLRTWSTLLDACREAGETGQQAVSLLSRMKNAGLKPDIWCFNHCLNAASRGGEWELAFGLLEDMGKAEVRPNSWSYSAAMKACVNAKEYQMVPVSSLPFASRLQRRHPAEYLIYSRNL